MLKHRFNPPPNGLATADKKHQIIVDAQAFGAGQEQHTLTPILEAIQQRFARLGIHDNLFDETLITADTGFASEDNNQYLHDNEINAYIPDNAFRSRDPSFAEQQAKYKDKQPRRDKRPRSTTHTYPASAFQFDPITETCTCPAGEPLSLSGKRKDQWGNDKIFFEGRLLQCRHCDQKTRCLKNPQSPNHRKGKGRQVSFILNQASKSPYTEWMKQRIDSDTGKHIYSHRMSVVEPVFGNITVNKQLNRFTLRGKTKVNNQWQLFCLIHNLEKLAHYGELATV